MPKISHGEAMVLAKTEFGRGSPVSCGSYTPTNGSARLSAHGGTSGPWWLTCSVAKAQASFRQFGHDYRTAAKRDGGPMIDAMTVAQVRDRAALTPAELIDRLAAGRGRGRSGLAVASRRWPAGLCG